MLVRVGLQLHPLSRRSGCTSAEPYPPPRSKSIVVCGRSSGNLLHFPRLLAGEFAALTGLLQLAVALGEDHFREAVQLVSRGEVPDRRMQPHVVVQHRNQTPMIPRVRFSIRGIPGSVNKLSFIKLCIGVIEQSFAVDC